MDKLGASTDFDLLPQLKKLLGGKRFGTHEEMTKAVDGY